MQWVRHGLSFSCTPISHTLVVAQFIVACQCNPHIVPFFYNSKGEVGRPSRWSSGGVREHSWRGGFLLSSLELYLKTDVRAKFRFLDEVEAALGFTSTMTTQTYGGTTTIVPQVSFLDYFKVSDWQSLVFGVLPVDADTFFLCRAAVFEPNTERSSTLLSRRSCCRL